MQIAILAAGQGKRMNSARPKVLHPIAGRPILAHILDAARSLSPRKLCVVYGHGGEQVRAALAAPDVLWAHQAQQLGTGHAVAQAMPLFEDQGSVMILMGDVPLIRPATLAALAAAAGQDRVAVLTVLATDPKGLGRIVRDEARALLGVEVG